MRLIKWFQKVFYKLTGRYLDGYVDGDPKVTLAEMEELKRRAERWKEQQSKERSS